MPTNIKHLLQKNRISLERFCDREEILSYKDLVRHCEQRGFEPCTEEEFKHVLSAKKLLKEPEKDVKSKSEPKKKTETKRRPGRKRTSGSSSTRKNTEVRDSD
jgi:hypothetical protein